MGDHIYPDYPPSRQTTATERVERNTYHLTNFLPTYLRYRPTDLLTHSERVREKVTL